MEVHARERIYYCMKCEYLAEEVWTRNFDKVIDLNVPDKKKWMNCAPIKRLIDNIGWVTKW